MRPLFSLILLFCISLIQCWDNSSNPVNNAPEIASVTLEPDIIRPGENAAATCIASDSNNDSIYYKWDSDAGIFPNGNDKGNVVWQAPNQLGNFTITCTVSDMENETSKSVIARVKIDNPVAPSGLTVTVIDSSRINLKWQDNSNNEDGFKVYRCIGSSSFKLIGKTGSGITYYEDNGIDANCITFTYEVCSYNLNGESHCVHEGRIIIYPSVEGHDIPRCGARSIPHPF